MQDTAGFLKTRGIMPSLQRIQIYNYIYGRKDHPSVDMIFSALSAQIPTLSKTTVYNTLKSFVEAGIATPVIIDENEIRYDADTHMHGHFKCDSCGNIFDFTNDFTKLDAPELKNFIIKEYHIYLKGICESCQTTNN